MIKKLSPKQYEQFAGHSLEVGMKFYAHVDTDDLREELFSKVFDKVEITQEEENEFRKEIEELKIQAKENKEYNISVMEFMGKFQDDIEMRQNEILYSNDPDTREQAEKEGKKFFPNGQEPFKSIPIPKVK